MVLLKMKICLFLALFCVWCGTVLSEGENEIKRGLYPFMGFIYYSDETVVDSSGDRFFRSAVLIRTEWILSSYIDTRVSFPRKTMLARMGAVVIDPKITLNEDEDEQEREVIQVVRPNNHDDDSWWVTDISLLKTLLPFKITFAVSPIVINPKHDYSDKTCIILFYTKRDDAEKLNSTLSDRYLQQLSVDMLPSTTDNCGPQFSNTTMACSTDNEDTKNTVLNNRNFCQENSGGPLICENEVMGLQTYIDNNCKPPHLYQLLSSWESLINCGISEKCNEDDLCNICNVTNKDDSALGDLSVTVPLNLSTTDLPLVSTENELRTENLTNFTTTNFTTYVTNVTTVQTPSDVDGEKLDKDPPKPKTDEIEISDDSYEDDVKNSNTQPKNETIVVLLRSEDNTTKTEDVTEEIPHPNANNASSEQNASNSHPQDIVFDADPIDATPQNATNVMYVEGDFNVSVEVGGPSTGPPENATNANVHEATYNISAHETDTTPSAHPITPPASVDHNTSYARRTFTEASTNYTISNASVYQNQKANTNVNASVATDDNYMYTRSQQNATKASDTPTPTVHDTNERSGKDNWTRAQQNETELKEQKREETHDSHAFFKSSSQSSDHGSDDEGALRDAEVEAKHQPVHVSRRQKDAASEAPKSDGTKTSQYGIHQYIIMLFTSMIFV